MPVSHSILYIVLSDKFHPRPQKLGHGSTHRSCRSGYSHGSLSVCVLRKMEGWSISHIRSGERKRQVVPPDLRRLPGTERLPYLELIDPTPGEELQDLYQTWLLFRLAG
jgi:hypothetical protein